jgi:gamma-glutamyl hydrolase
MIEAFNYPIYGSQWHPEKNNFEFSKTEEGMPLEATDHSKNAVFVSQYMANFFVTQAHLSDHAFPSEAVEDEALIYNYTPTRTAGTGFVQQYFFHF